ncbi:hypothetical protein BDC45DRAFT_542311 [Circinella umbellata]|nr:hypothetical protein BDC45DRAFT_542311 [Circinella umbellata]
MCYVYDQKLIYFGPSENIRIDERYDVENQVECSEDESRNSKWRCSQHTSFLGIAIFFGTAKIYPITFDYDMLLRFKQNIVNNRTINNESTISRTTAIESSAMESSLFEVISTSSKVLTVAHYKHLQIAAAAEAAAIIISLKTLKIHVPFVTPLSVKGKYNTLCGKMDVEQ